MDTTLLYTVVVEYTVVIDVLNLNSIINHVRKMVLRVDGVLHDTCMSGYNTIAQFFFF